MFWKLNYTWFFKEFINLKKFDYFNADEEQTIKVYIGSFETYTRNCEIADGQKGLKER